MAVELMTEVPESGTKLRLELDRPIDRPTGDSVMRVLGITPEGESVFDAAYVETSAQESQLIAGLVRQVVAPTPEVKDRIAQEIHALFSSRLTGRDVAQIADIVWLAQWEALREQVGVGDRPNTRDLAQALAERFERASSRIQAPYGPGSTPQTSKHGRGNGH